METFHLGLNISRSLILCTLNSFCVCYYLLQKEDCSMMPEQDSGLWVQPNVIRSNFIATFF